jgi:hypothetical protein
MGSTLFFASFQFQFHQTNRTEPEPILHNFIRGFGISRLPRALPHIRSFLPLPHPITPLSALNALPLSSHLPPFFVRSSFLSLTLPCIPLIVQSICSSFNPSTWAPFAVVLRFALSFLLLFRPNLPFKVIDFDADVNLFHFMLLRCVGKGAFGKVPFSPMVIPISLPINHLSQVRVVQHKQTRDLYALKYINKTKCVRMKAVANVIQERRLLEEVCLLARLLFPFTSNLSSDRPSFCRQSTIRFPGR